MKRILISGARGLVGSALVAALRERGDEVGSLVRGTARDALDVLWDPTTGTIDSEALAAGRFDAVVHLAGEPLLGRWTAEKQDEIRRSRVDGTKLIASAIGELDVRPTAFVVASAVGFYGDRGDELLTETSAPGSSFLASVVSDWEAAADPARTAEIRTAHLRMGVVLSRHGGALREQLLPFKLGLGGCTGSGRQWMPWIGMHDLVRVYLLAIDDERIDGPVNAVGPTPSRNAEFVKLLGRLLHRPTILPVPLPLLRARYSRELVEEMLLHGQKVVPARLEALDFEFDDRTLELALRRALAT